MNDIDEEIIADAPLRAYLEIAYRYYEEDRLDAAAQVTLDAFEHKGWPAGQWTAFYNQLMCEKDARDASSPQVIDDGLSLELFRQARPDLRARLKTAAIAARETIRERLSVKLVRPVIVTVFLPGAAVDFIPGSHGYMSVKTEHDKICLPYHSVTSQDDLEDALVHEFAHCGYHELAGTGRPTWLNEGIATYLCRDLENRHVRFVIRTAARKKLPSASRMENVLQSSDLRKDDPQKVQTAYYLSASLVSWWVDHRGFGTVRDALERIGNGENPKHAIREAAGMSLREMEDGWRRDLSGEAATNEHRQMETY